MSTRQAHLYTASAIGFLLCIVAANYATTHLGGADHLLPVTPWGLYAVAGTWFAGATFVLRDTVQDTGGRWAIIILIVLGAAVSYTVAPALAVASGVAFLLAETCDLIVYTPLRRRGYVRAAVASNIVGSVVDTWVFLTLAGFVVTWEVMAGQVVAKLTVTALVVAAVLAVRASRARSVVPAT
jgi:uncharacterized PurR-regulated membrane protein YhhQ (DUF165 family)